MADIQPAAQKLKHSINGEVVLPGDPAYEQASTTILSKGTPAIIVVPKTSEDIVRTLSFARQNGLVVSVRNGGHSNAGHSTNSGGLVIDMRHFSDVKVLDKERRIVRVGAGAIWEDVATALQPYEWAISSGDSKTVGVAGLTLAGGIGWIVRRDGLTLDNLAAADVVTADGRLLHVNQTEHPDLFWAIRGGGGNFGICTSFEFIAHPAEHVFAGTVKYDIQDVHKVLRGWRDYMRTAPEELTSIFLIMPSNPAFASMPAMIMITLCYVGGNEADVMKTIEPLLNLSTPVDKDIKRKDYADVLEEARPPQGVKVITNNAFIRTLSDELIDVICQTGQMLQIRSLGGAMNRVDSLATAFVHRNNEVLIVAPVFIKSDANQEAIQQAQAPWRKIEPFANGAYSSFFGRDTQDVVAAAYPWGVYEKLARIKQQYDPENLFSQNYNIKPAAHHN